MHIYIYCMDKYNHTRAYILHSNITRTHAQVHVACSVLASSMHFGAQQQEGRRVGAVGGGRDTEITASFLILSNPAAGLDQMSKSRFFAGLLMLARETGN